MATAAKEDISSDDLTVCPICFEVFKIPKSLPCLHTFCKACLVTFLTKYVQSKESASNAAQCPVCRADLQAELSDEVSADKWVDGLPTNHVINSLIERGRLENGSKNCSICERRGDCTSATSWCKNCGEAYCVKCIDLHKNFKLLMDHEIIELGGELPDDPLIMVDHMPDCSTHKNRKLELFCFDHEDPCCLTCMTVNHRKCEKVMTLDEAAENFRESSELSDLSSRLNEMVSEYSKSISDHESIKAEVSSDLRDMRTQLNNTKDTMIKHIENLHQKLDEELQVIEKQKDIENPLAELEQRRAQLQHSVRTLNTLRKKSSNVSLFLEFYKLKGKEVNNRRFICRHTATCETEKINIIADVKTQVFSSLIPSLGKIKKTMKSSHKQKPNLLSCVPQKMMTLRRTDSKFADAVLLKSGVIIAVDDLQNKIWAYSSKGVALSSAGLFGKPWAVTVVNENDVVCSLPSTRAIHYVSFACNTENKRFHNEKTIITTDAPYGLDSIGDKLVVSFKEKNIRIMELDGTVIHKINTGIIEQFSQCDNLYGISYFNGNLFVTDHNLSRVFSLGLGSREGMDFRLKYSTLRFPLGVTVDNDGNLYIAGFGSNNVIQVAPDGTSVREILTIKNGIKSPEGINFSKHDLKFVMTHGDTISVFEMVPPS